MWKHNCRKMNIIEISVSVTSNHFASHINASNGRSTKEMETKKGLTAVQTFARKHDF